MQIIKITMNVNVFMIPGTSFGTPLLKGHSFLSKKKIQFKHVQYFVEESIECHFE